MLFTMANPSPLPVLLVVKLGMKIRFEISGEIPLPLSDIFMAT
jgi:hypothetical protein